MTKVFNAQGEVVKLTGEIPVNDLTRAPRYMDELPEQVMFVPVVVPAADGETPRIALVSPTLIATTEEVTASILAAVNTARQEFVDAGIERDRVQQEQIDRADEFASDLSAAVAAITAKKQPTLIGTATITQTATVAVTAGVRFYNATVQGLAAGEPVILAPVSVPNGYNPGLGFVSAANTLRIPVTCPALALGASFSFDIKVFAFR